MTAIITRPEDVINLALARIGYKDSVSSILDGTPASRLALTFYSQTRDQMIRDGNWAFAERIAEGVLLKSAPQGGYNTVVPWSPAYPALPWFYEYGYPADCLKVRSMRPQAIYIPNFVPQYNVFSEENDNSYNPPVKVILCNVPNAIITYAGQVTDPTTWEASFIEAFAAALGRRLAPGLVGLESAKLEIQDEQAETSLADRTQG